METIQAILFCFAVMSSPVIIILILNLIKKLIK